MIALESSRLHIRDMTEDDLPKALPIILSNPDFLRLAEGSEGEAGRFDLDRWQRDWQIAQMMPGRHILVCELKQSGEIVGFADFLEEHEDGAPWIGALVIHKAHQRQGIGTETFERLCEHFRVAYSWPLLRAGVIERNEGGLAFVQGIGFQPIRREERHLAGGMLAVVTFEFALAA